MKYEIFRLSNLAVSHNGVELLSAFNLNECKGECLGLYGLSSRRRAAVSDILCGRLRPDHGTVFIDGTAVPYEDAASRLSDRIACINTEPLLIDEMTVWENMMVLRRSKRLLGDFNAIRRYVAAVLDEFDVNFAFDDAVLCLSRISRLEAAILKCWMAGKKVFIIQDAVPSCDRRESEQFRKFLSSLCSRGASFIITSGYLSILTTYCSRVAIMNEGRVSGIVLPTDISPDKESGQAAIESEKTVIIGEPSAYLPLTLNNLQNVVIPFYDGATVAVLDFSGRVEGALKKIRSRKGIESALIVDSGIRKKYRTKGKLLFAEFSPYGSINHNISAVDNLTLGLHRRLTKCGIICNKRIEYVKKDFETLYGDPGILNAYDCSKFNHTEEMAVVTYKMDLARPKLLLYLDTGSGRPSTAQGFVEYEIAKLKGEGTAVCVLLSEIEFRGNFADKYIVVTDDGVYYDVPYEVVLERSFASLP